MSASHPPVSEFGRGIDGLAEWRGALLQGVKALHATVIERDLATSGLRQVLRQLMTRLESDRLVLAFVGEFSRGKSELINAIFFGDTGRRMLPAAPGRTTMCPVELAHDRAHPPGLALLPISTRLEALSLAELRHQRDRWVHRPMPVERPADAAEALAEVTRTEWVSKEQAEALGFWHDDDLPEDSPPCNEFGQVQIPAWRHAVLNLPHPLLDKGLVVIDTPGLNAVGAEPELTLGLLPSAHATVFVVGADTGVTRSDLALWRDHLADHTACRYVALNKLDTLADPLATADELAAHIDAQRTSTAQALLQPISRVFPLSARSALAARIAGDDAAYDASGLPALEQALAAELVTARRGVLAQSTASSLDRVGDLVSRKVGDERRSAAEQRAELEAVRGKSAARVERMAERIQAEVTDFERCSSQLKALRLVQQRIDAEMRTVLSPQRLADEVAALQATMDDTLLGSAARRAFTALCDGTRGALARAEALAGENRLGIGAAFRQLNADFGLALTIDPPADFTDCHAEIDAIEANYLRYFSLTQRLRPGRGDFHRKFVRMLGAKLRLLFESALGSSERWNNAAWTHVSLQMAARRRTFHARQQSLKRVMLAAGELEQRLAALEQRDVRLIDHQRQISRLLLRLRRWATADDGAALVDSSEAPFDPAPIAPMSQDSDRPTDLALLATGGELFAPSPVPAETAVRDSALLETATLHAS